jgi:hypothetical protein
VDGKVAGERGQDGGDGGGDIMRTRRNQDGPEIDEGLGVHETRSKNKDHLVSVEAEYILPGYGVNGSLCGTYKPGRILVPDEWIDG